MLGVDSLGEGFNYGYKPKEEDEKVMFILVRHAGGDSSGEGFNYGYKPKEEDEQVMFILVRHAGGGQLRGRI